MKHETVDRDTTGSIDFFSRIVGSSARVILAAAAFHAFRHRRRRKLRARIPPPHRTHTFAR
jgi:heme A synthase